ncbi:MAG: hypothetical protein KY476_12375, partial [Planctomycetes bacterium]|nr:hypothetical protein [Planctomycetota bacterium]
MGILQERSKAMDAKARKRKGRSGAGSIPAATGSATASPLRGHLACLCTFASQVCGSVGGVALHLGDDAVADALLAEGDQGFGV